MFIIINTVRVVAESACPGFLHADFYIVSTHTYQNKHLTKTKKNTGRKAYECNILYLKKRLKMFYVSLPFEAER